MPAPLPMPIEKDSNLNTADPNPLKRPCIAPERDDNLARLDNIHDICGRMANLSEQETAAIHRLTYKWLLVDDDNKSIYCAISKAASSAWKYMLLKQKVPSLKKSMTVHSYGYLDKHGFKYLHRYNQSEADQRLKDYYKYVIVRHPLARLSSAYRDKFTMKDEPHYGNAVAGKIKSRVRPQGEDVPKMLKFEELIKHMTLTDPLTHDRHWIPQYFVCNPCLINFDYVAKVETLQEDRPLITTKLNINSNTLQPLNTHSNASRQSYHEYYKNVSYTDLTRLLSIYMYDFKLFNYAISEDILSYLKKSKNTFCNQSDNHV